MSSISTSSQRPFKLWQLIVFAVVAVLGFAFFSFFFGGAFALLSPLGVGGQAATSTYHPEIHRWHDGMWGAFATILLGGTLLSLVWGGQKRPLLAQFFLVSLFLFVVVTLPFPGGFDPMSIITGGAIMAIFLLAYPARREIFTFRRAESLSTVLLAVTIIAALCLAPDIWRNVLWQLTDKTSEHAKNFHWITSAMIDVLIIIAGLLASTKRGGWNALSMIVGLALLYLGAAALLVPHHAGSWGIVGGVLAIIGGLAYIVGTLYEMRRVPQIARATPSGVLHA